MMSRRNARAAAKESTAESRQPEDEGRRTAASTTSTTPAAPPPRTPRSTAVITTGINGAPTTPKSATTNPFTKTRCYRLNLEKPFDFSAASTMSSPSTAYHNSRDYTGPINEADLPPSAGPQEYYPPPHLCPRDLLRRHSWGGHHNTQNYSDSASELMANLQVSGSEDSSSNPNVTDTTIAISTARIFRGITVDRNGVITSQNARATRSRKGTDAKNKVGEKSRQAAKIDKAKDLIDDVENGGGEGGGNDENDPTKVVSLYIMGEYEELNDLVRDGSKKLRDGKSLSDDALFSYNRPCPIPPHIMSPSNSSNSIGRRSTMDPASPANRKRGGASSLGYSPSSLPHHSVSRTSVAGTAGGVGIGGVDNNSKSSRSRYKQVPRSAPPKLKSHPRDRPSARRLTSPRIGNQRSDSSMNYNGTEPKGQQQQQQQQQQQRQPHYFREQCNFSPFGNSDWTEALGFSVNSLWNCGANNGHMSPMSNPSSPRSHHSGSAYGGGGGGGGGHPESAGGYGGTAGGYGGYQYHGHRNGGGGYNEDRNPSGGYGYGDEGYARSRNGGVRDTVVM